MTSDDDDRGFDARTGRAKYYLDENDNLVPVKSTGLSTFIAFMMLSLVGVGVSVTRGAGSWWLHILGVIAAIVGLVGTNNYKWRTYYWDAIVLGLCAISIYLHLKYGSL